LNKVAWAHPEFGSLIAVACDRQILIYEEACFGTGKTVQSWFKRATLSDARAPITDLKFSPKLVGLQLITCSQNGEVRIYECSDILHGHTWTLFHPELRTNFNSCSSCSWSTCFNLPILLALGSDESSSNIDKLSIFEYNESNRTYSKTERVVSQNNVVSQMINEPINSLAFAPSIGKLYHVLAIASKSLLVSTIKPT
jgi:nucleoporin SEH1